MDCHMGICMNENGISRIRVAPNPLYKFKYPFDSTSEGTRTKQAKSSATLAPAASRHGSSIPLNTDIGQ
ncbi:hypothetical protein ACOME3_002075 [Neoechinorhynchus agilis]